MNNNLKEIRLKKKMTMQELANASGLNITTINFYENGRLDLWKADFGSIIKLTGALKCSIYELYGVENGRELLTICKKKYQKQFEK